MGPHEQLCRILAVRPPGVLAEEEGIARALACRTVAERQVAGLTAVLWDHLACGDVGLLGAFVRRRQRAC